MKALPGSRHGAGTTSTSRQPLATRRAAARSAETVEEAIAAAHEARTGWSGSGRQRHRHRQGRERCDGPAPGLHPDDVLRRRVDVGLRRPRRGARLMIGGGGARLVGIVYDPELTRPPRGRVRRHRATRSPTAPRRCTSPGGTRVRRRGARRYRTHRLLASSRARRRKRPRCPPRAPRGRHARGRGIGRRRPRARPCDGSGARRPLRNLPRRPQRGLPAPGASLQRAGRRAGSRASAKRSGAVRCSPASRAARRVGRVRAFEGLGCSRARAGSSPRRRRSGPARSEPTPGVAAQIADLLRSVW